MVLHSVTGKSSALTAITESAATSITVSGPVGAVYSLRRVEIQNYPTVETVVNSGGKVRLTNDSKDWQPFEICTNSVTTVGAGAGGCELNPTIVNCNVPLPAGSTTKAYFTPFDNQSQIFAVTLIYEMVPFVGAQTYFLSSLGSAITQTTISANHLSFTIPATKGGRAISINILNLGTIETVVDSGGLCSLHMIGAKPEAIEPLDFYCNGITSVTLGGGIQRIKEVSLSGYALLDQQILYVDFTPQDNQSQNLFGFIAWER